MSTDNGILAKIPGEHIGAALQTLPDPASAKSETLEVERDVPGIGRVRFTAVLYKSKHGKSVIYFWGASKAVLIEG